MSADIGERYHGHGFPLDFNSNKFKSTFFHDVCRLCLECKIYYSVDICKITYAITCLEHWSKLWDLYFQCGI